jgi:hypothetical protein
MRKYVLSFSFLLFLVYTLSFQTASSRTSQPDAGNTKDPVNNQSCARSGCHGSLGFFNANRANVTIGTTSVNQVAINGFQYSPGTTYIINFTVPNSSKPGFSMSALTSSNTNAGTFAVTNSTNTSLLTQSGISYIGHKSANSNSTWSFNWTAPASNVGNITFYSAVNKSNALGTSSGDSIFHQQYVITAAALSVSVGNDATICPGGSTQLQAAASSTSGTTYAWSPATGLSCTTCANPIANPTAATTYTVTVTNNGQTATDAVNVNVYTASTPTINSTANTVCPNGSVTLSSSGFNSYSWSTGGNSASTQVSAGGTYNLTVTDANGCSATASKSIQQGTTPVPSIVSTAPYICGTSSVTLNPGSFSSYTWSNNSTSQTISVNQAGAYTVTVTNASGCTGTASINLQQIPLPVANVSASGPLTFCAGGSVTLTAQSGSGYSYKWSDGSTTSSITVTQSGNYRVTVYNPCDSAVSLLQTVAVNQVPNAQLDPVGPLLLCNGLSQTITASPSGASYVWLNNGNVVAGQSSSTLSVNSNGSYSAVVTVSGCADTSEAVSVSTAGTGNAEVDIQASQSFICAGDVVTLNAGQGFSSYNWQPGNSNSQTVQVTTAGTYIVNVVVNNGQCNSTGADTIEIVDGQEVVAPVLSYNTSVCAGDTVTISLNQAYSSYLWSDGSTNSTLSAVTGPYSVTVSQNGSCGTASSSINATGTPLPDATFTVSTALLTANTSGASYQWYLDGSPVNGANSDTFLVSQTGNYSLQVTQNGCSAISEPVRVVVSGLAEESDIVFSMYPNPAVDWLVLKANGLSEPSYRTIISSADGSISRELELVTNNGQLNATVSIADIPTGIYVVRFLTPTAIRTVRFTKQQ